MPRHFRTSMYITCVYNSQFCACIYSQNTCVRGGGGSGVCVCTCLCALWLNHKLSSPGSFWSFWPFSTSARKRERRDKEEMFRISTVPGLLSLYSGGGGLLELRVVIHHHVTLSKNLLGRSQLRGVRFL